MMDARSARFLVLYTRSLLKLKYRHTYLGFLWNFLEPALYLAVLSVVFSVVNRMEVGNYAVYLFGALVPWRYFERSVGLAMESIVAGDWLLKKMPVSPLVFPLSRWLLAGVEFLISFLVVLLLFLVLKERWTVHLVVLPAAMLVWALLAAGIGLICAAAFVFFRDIRPVVQMVLMLVFFTSPILFRADLFPAGSLQAGLLRLHPMTYLAALFQKPLYFAAWPAPADWTVSIVIGALAALLGSGLVARTQGRFYFYL